MIKKAAALSGVAGQFVQLLGRTALGGLCGVGLVWILTMLSPAGRQQVHRIGDQIQQLAAQNPEIAVGLLLGTFVSLGWHAARR